MNTLKKNNEMEKLLTVFLQFTENFSFLLNTFSLDWTLKTS